MSEYIGKYRTSMLGYIGKYSTSMSEYVGTNQGCHGQGKVLENEKNSRSGKSRNYIFSQGNLKKNDKSHGKAREFQNFP